MDKKCAKMAAFVFLMVLVLATAAMSPVFAEERNTGFSSGVNVGVARFSDGDLGTGFSGRVFVEYAPYIHEIALRLSGGYLRFEDDVTLGQGAFSSSEDVVFEDFYLTGGIIYRFSRGKIVPFVTANVGVYHYRKEDVSAAVGPVIDGVQVSPYDTVESLEGNDFGFNVGGGVEFFMNERTSISVEMLLHSITGEVDSEIFDVTAMFRFFPHK
jgi:opacity protein-like surface antigen